MSAITAAWHVIRAVLTVTGAACWSVAVVMVSWVLLDAWKARRRRARGVREGVARLEALLLEDAAGGGWSHGGSAR